MKHFGSSRYRLWGLPRDAKLIYTCFCALSLLAVASSLLLYEDLVGPTLRGGHLQRVGAYYSASAPAVAAPLNPSPSPAERGVAPGPAIDLPAEAAEAPAAEPPGKLTVTVPYRKLLEVTHFHLFTVPVFLLVLTHLFALSGIAARWRLFWIAFGWIAGTLHILAPWAVRYGGSRLNAVFPISGAGFLVAALVLCLYPAVAMWKPPPASPRPKTRHSRHETESHKETPAA